MIEVIKILEGGIDLRTGTEEPKTLVLAGNGAVAMMPISDEQLRIVLSLLGAQEHPQVESPQAPAAPTPSMPSLAEAPQNGASSFEKDEEPEVGETYDDPETGVSSF